MTKGYQLLILVTFFFLSHLSFAQKAKEVLFVGNSYTYFWNLPQTVEIMIKSMEMDFQTAQSTAGGATWQEHWDGEKA